MKSLVLATLIFLASCAASQPVPISIVSGTCGWDSKITLSDATIVALGSKLGQNADVRHDIEQIVVHNELYEKYCGSPASGPGPAPAAH